MHGRLRAALALGLLAGLAEASDSIRGMDHGPQVDRHSPVLGDTEAAECKDSLDLISPGTNDFVRALDTACCESRCGLACERREVCLLSRVACRCQRQPLLGTRQELMRASTYLWLNSLLGMLVMAVAIALAKKRDISARQACKLQLACAAFGLLGAAVGGLYIALGVAPRGQRRANVGVGDAVTKPGTEPVSPGSPGSPRDMPTYLASAGSAPRSF